MLSGFRWSLLNLPPEKIQLLAMCWEKYLLLMSLRPQVLPDLKLAFRHYEISSQLGYGPSSVQLSLFKMHMLIRDW